jgi:hypothetical protein
MYDVYDSSVYGTERGIAGTGMAAAVAILIRFLEATGHRPQLPLHLVLKSDAAAANPGRTHSMIMLNSQQSHNYIINPQ